MSNLTSAGLSNGFWQWIAHHMAAQKQAEGRLELKTGRYLSPHRNPEYLFSKACLAPGSLMRTVILQAAFHITIVTMTSPKRPADAVIVTNCD